MKRYVMEFIGTFFLVLTIGMCVINRDLGNLAPIAIGSALMIMIYAGGHICGAHYNPAVTLAVWLRGKCPTADVPAYMAAQILGAVLAGALVSWFKQYPALTPDTHSVLPSLVAEFLGTFALASVVLNVATSKDTAGNSNYGLAIGFTVTAMAFALGPVSGGAFNPAVAVGGAVMKLFTPSSLWIYFVAPLGAGAVAAIVFKWMNPSDP